MAVTVTANLTTVNEADIVTGWSGGTVYTGWQREGAACLGGQVSQATTNFIHTGTSRNLTGQRVYAWVAPWGNPDTKANGGLGIVIGDGTHSRAYFLNGQDDYGFQIGTWICMVLDAGNLPTSFTQVTGSTAPNLTAITQFGVRFKMLNKASGNSPNAFFDVIRFGTGLTISGGSAGSPGKFSEIVTEDESTAAGKAFGIIRRLAPGVFGVQGDLTFSGYFKDQDAVLVFEDRIAGAGTQTVLNVAATGSHFELGVPIGSGDTQTGQNGVQFRTANALQPVSFVATAATLGLFYGCSWSNISAAGVGPAFSSDATNGPNYRLSSAVFDGCGRVDTGRAPIRNSFVNGYSLAAHGGLVWSANINVKNCTFLANSSANSPAAIVHPAAGTFTYDNLRFAGNSFDVHNSSAGLVTINATNNANPATNKNTGGGSTTINNPSLFTITVRTEAGAALTGFEWRIYEADPGDGILGTVELAGEEIAAASTQQYAYNYGVDTDIVVQIIHTGYEEEIFRGTLINADQTVILNLKAEENI